MNNKRHKKRDGFTLMEVLVAIAIFVILLTISLINYRDSERSIDFRLTAFDIEDRIDGVQNMAFTGKKINGEIPTNGYGIFFNKDDNSYLTYGDKLNVGFQKEEDLLDERNYLKDGISISEIICDKNPVEYLDISFLFPKAKIIVNNQEITGSQGGEGYKECNLILSSDKASGNWIVSINILSTRVNSSFRQ